MTVPNNLLHTIITTLVDGTNGCEAIVITTDFYRDTPDDEFYITQGIDIPGYVNISLKFDDCVFTPEILRELADKIDEQMILHTLTNP